MPHFDTKWEVEQHVAGLGLRHTFLRPVFFMENFLSPDFLPALRRGRLALPLGEGRRLQMVAVDDIGRFAAAALLDPERFAGGAVGLAGDEMTLPGAVQLLSEAAGFPIRYGRMAEEEAESAFCPNWRAMFRWFEAVGYGVDVAGLEGRWGMSMLTLAEWIGAAGPARCLLRAAGQQVRPPVRAAPDPL